MARMDMPLTFGMIASLETVTRGPCLSLYQETHRSSPDNKQDPIRFRNLVKMLETSLKEKYPETILSEFLEPLKSFENDTEFWAHTMEGLAVLVGINQFHVFRLQQPVRELAVVENVFFLAPLRRYLQSTDRFQILGLSLHGLKIFEGNRNYLDELIPAPGVPVTIESALGEEQVDSEKENNVDIETEKYFRAADKAVLKYYSHLSGLPLILACLPEHQSLFHRISNNPFLLGGGIGINPETVSLDELKERAWQHFEPQYTKRLTALIEEYKTSHARGLGSDDVALIAKAAAEGRVATLLLEPDLQGYAEKGKILEDLAEMVGKMGGQVQIISSDRMPGRTGVAASYRY